MYYVCYACDTERYVHATIYSRVFRRLQLLKHIHIIIWMAIWRCMHVARSSSPKKRRSSACCECWTGGGGVVRAKKVIRNRRETHYYSYDIQHHTTWKVPFGPRSTASYYTYESTTLRIVHNNIYCWYVCFLSPRLT